LQPWHLVNLSKQKYGVEPNARFSPDHKLVIFTSNMFGPSYLFAVGTDVDPTHSVSLIYNVGGAEVKGK
jgi:oligogalacturonide lyase